MKTLKKIIEENKKYFTTNKVAYCSVNTGKVVGRYDIEDLVDEQLNRQYYKMNWFIEDDELCIKLY